MLLVLGILGLLKYGLAFVPYPMDRLKGAAIAPTTQKWQTSSLEEAPLVVKRDIESVREQGSASDEERNGIVIIAGFEQFNLGLYKKAAATVQEKVPGVPISVFTDRDIEEKQDEVQLALNGAKVVFCSLIFDFKQVKWLVGRIDKVQTRFCFESSLELMSETKVNSFVMKGGGGAPAPVKALLRQLGSDKEEDKLQGYLKFLKIGPKMLKWVPVSDGKIADLRNWLTVYAYWTEGGLENVINMLYQIIQEPSMGLAKTPHPASSEGFGKTAPLQLSKAIVEYPAIGLYHPMQIANAERDLTGATPLFFDTPAEYEKWYLRTHPWVKESTPRVALLLYRKHVLTEQAYIPNLIKLMETEGIMPVPVFINGVEAHTVVRDLLTSPYESRLTSPSKTQAVSVDAIVNTIGFPLVGGPAGSMEGGRGIELAKEILSSKNIPYYVAAPLLIQDIDSWSKSGVQGLQQVVLYSLPELDGAIEAVVLGGLVGGDNIVIIPERVRKLLSRVKSKIALRKKNVEDRSVSFICYGFPPAVGAVGTAALLNVEKSLENTLVALNDEGYDVGTVVRADSAYSVKGKRLGGGNVDGEDIVKALKLLARDDLTAGGAAKAQEALDDAGFWGMNVVGRTVTHKELTGWLGKTMTQKMEAQWGSLESYSEIACSGSGKFSVLGLQFGKVFVGVQPVLGIEGDPMRMLFERDLTPHPQYAAFYKWISEEQQPDTIVHFGMHGTVEWLPGSPLGNTAESWSDVLLGSATNVYLYACNNPSESILAKRRGYATVVSHNVPPYARAGLYKELLSLKGAVAEFKEEEVLQRQHHQGESASSGKALLAPIAVVASLVRQAGLESDIPFPGSQFSNDGRLPSEFEAIEKILSDASQAEAFLGYFTAYATDLAAYLVVLENRLFSEGLYVLGQDKTAEQAVLSYLDALYGQDKSTSKGIDQGKDSANFHNGGGFGSIAASSALGTTSDTGTTSIASAALSGSSTETNRLEQRTKLAPETLHAIALGAAHAYERGGGAGIAGTSSSRDAALDSALLFKALSVQKKANMASRMNTRASSSSDGHFSPVLEHFSDMSEIRQLWEANAELSRQTGTGVNWSDALTDEDKFGLSLLMRGDFSEFLMLQLLKWKRAWGHPESEKRIQDLVLAGAGTAGAHVKGENSDLRDAVKLARLLIRNPSTELSSLINAIGGSYVAPAAGGDLIRDGPSVLPTGSNIHALDPYRIPSNTALRRGQIAAEKIVGAHRKQNNGKYPETVAVTLWGLDVIKTKGESIGIVLGLVGAIPVREATGRIVSFDLIPIRDLGRPRIDVVASLSGIFRDTFANVLTLLDELFEKAAAEELSSAEVAFLLEEIPGESDFNFLRKHTTSMGRKGISRPTSRLFSQPPGDFGSMVNEQVGSGNWEEGAELGDQWESRNSYSYGAGTEGSGAARPDVLKELLSTTERVVQEVDSVEYGLTDIQEYYANTGGLKKAAENNSAKGAGAQVGISIVEAFQEEVEPKELEETLRMEYRTKLLNPVWADAMRRQGSGGVYEVSTRMTAMIGWAGTCGFQEEFVFDGAAQTYALDANMADHLRNANPEAFRNIIKRMLEASGRGMWNPSEEVLEKLQELYSEAEDEVEGVNI